jgi:hypothetical protein
MFERLPAGELNLKLQKLLGPAGLLLWYKKVVEVSCLSISKKVHETDLLQIGFKA